MDKKKPKHVYVYRGGSNKIVSFGSRTLYFARLTNNESASRTEQLVPKPCHFDEYLFDWSISCVDRIATEPHSIKNTFVSSISKRSASALAAFPSVFSASSVDHHTIIHHSSDPLTYRSGKKYATEYAANDVHVGIAVTRPPCKVDFWTIATRPMHRLATAIVKRINLSFSVVVQIRLEV
jgi:hypothetical protein